jgi:hypothetical protein
MLLPTREHTQAIIKGSYLMYFEDWARSLKLGDKVVVHIHKPSSARSVPGEVIKVGRASVVVRYLDVVEATFSTTSGLKRGHADKSIWWKTRIDSE